MATTPIGRAPGRGAGAPAGRSAAPSGPRHPLVAVAMVLPLAILLAVAFGGWHDFVVQASQLAELMGR